MADKEKLKGGLANLFSGANQEISKPKTEETEAEAAAPHMEVEPTTSQDETDLLTTIEDGELRAVLEKRLQQRRLIGRGRPRKNTDATGRRMDGYSRTSLIISVDKWAKIKEIAFRETLTMKEIVELALDMVIERYESKHGEVKPQPERPKRNLDEIF